MPDERDINGKKEEHPKDVPSSPAPREKEKEGVGQWVQRQFLKHALPWMPGGMMAFPDMVEEEEEKPECIVADRADALRRDEEVRSAPDFSKELLDKHRGQNTAQQRTYGQRLARVESQQGTEQLRAIHLTRLKLEYDVLLSPLTSRKLLRAYEQIAEQGYTERLNAPWQVRTTERDAFIAHVHSSLPRLRSLVAERDNQVLLYRTGSNEQRERAAPLVAKTQKQIADIFHAWPLKWEALMRLTDDIRKAGAAEELSNALPSMPIPEVVVQRWQEERAADVLQTGETAWSLAMRRERIAQYISVIQENEGQYIRENQPLIRAAAIEYLKTHPALKERYSLEEFEQEAAFACFRALKYYDSYRGTAFSTLLYKFVGYQMSKMHGARAAQRREESIQVKGDKEQTPLVELAAGKTTALETNDPRVMELELFDRMKAHLPRGMATVYQIFTEREGKTYEEVGRVFLAIAQAEARKEGKPIPQTPPLFQSVYPQIHGCRERMCELLYLEIVENFPPPYSTILQETKWWRSNTSYMELRPKNIDIVAAQMGMEARQARKTLGIALDMLRKEAYETWPTELHQRLLPQGEIETMLPPEINHFERARIQTILGKLKIFQTRTSQNLGTKLRAMGEESVIALKQALDILEEAELEGEEMDAATVLEQIEEILLEDFTQKEIDYLIQENTFGEKIRNKKFSARRKLNAQALEAQRKFYADLLEKIEKAESKNTNIDIRPAQLKSLQAFKVFLREAVSDRGYFRLPTGAGKTVLFGLIAQMTGAKTLILVPTTNLVTQTRNELIGTLGIPESEIGVVHRGNEELGKTITIATYQSHRSKMRNGGAYADQQKSCAIIVCDEVHMALGPETQDSLATVDDREKPDSKVRDFEAEKEVLSDPNFMGNPRALKLGFTATGELRDKSVEEYFETLIAEESYANVAKAKYVVPYRLTQVTGTVEAGEVDHTLSEAEEIQILERNQIYRQLLVRYKEARDAHNRTKSEKELPMRPLACCVNYKECLVYQAIATELGIKTAVVTGHTIDGIDPDERMRRANEDLNAGRIEMIITVQKVAVGYDNKLVNAAIIARASQSPAYLCQFVGRTSRASTDPNVEKSCSWIFEADWSMGGERQGQMPLRVADAYAREGENPTEFMTNVNGEPVEFEYVYRADAEGYVQIAPGKKGVVLSKLCRTLQIRESTLEGWIKRRKLDPVGRTAREPVYDATDVLGLPEVKGTQSEVRPNGIVHLSDNRVGIAPRAYAATVNLSIRTLQEWLAASQLSPITEIERNPIYDKDAFDALIRSESSKPRIELKMDGTVAMPTGATGIVIREYSTTVNMEPQTLWSLIDTAELVAIGNIGGIDIFARRDTDRLVAQMRAQKITTRSTGLFRTKEGAVLMKLSKVADQFEIDLKLLQQWVAEDPSIQPVAQMGDFGLYEKKKLQDVVDAHELPKNPDGTLRLPDGEPGMTLEMYAGKHNLGLPILNSWIRKKNAAPARFTRSKKGVYRVSAIDAAVAQYKTVALPKNPDGTLQLPNGKRGVTRSIYAGMRSTPTSTITNFMAEAEPRPAAIAMDKNQEVFDIEDMDAMMRQREAKKPQKHPDGTYKLADGGRGMTLHMFAAEKHIDYAQMYRWLLRAGGAEPAGLIVKQGIYRVEDLERIIREIRTQEAQKLLAAEVKKDIKERDYQEVLEKTRQILGQKGEDGKEVFTGAEIEQRVREGVFGDEIVRVAAEERTALEGLVQEDVTKAMEQFRVNPEAIYRLGSVEVLGKIAVELGVKVSDGTNVETMQEEIVAKIKK